MWGWVGLQDRVNEKARSSAAYSGLPFCLFVSKRTYSPCLYAQRSLCSVDRKPPRGLPLRSRMKGAGRRPWALIVPHVGPRVGRAYSTNEKEEVRSERSDQRPFLMDSSGTGLRSLHTPQALGAEEGRPPAALRRPLRARGGHTQVETSQCVGTLPLLLVCGHFDVIHDERHPATKHVHSGTREGRVGDDCRGGAKLEATSSIQKVLNTLGPLALPRTQEALDVARSCLVAQPS